MTMTVYRSTDVGAPALTGRPGSLINLLDKCLVDGYGSKAGAGWTRPFTGPVGGRPSYYTNTSQSSSGTGTAWSIAGVWTPSCYMLQFVMTYHASDTTYTVTPYPGVVGWTNLLTFRFGSANQYMVSVFGKAFPDVVDSQFGYQANTSPGNVPLNVTYAAWWHSVYRVDLDGTPPVVVDAAALAGTTINGPALTTTNPDDLILAGLVMPEATSSVTTPAGYTNVGTTVWGTPQARMNLAWTSQSVVGAGSATWTRSTNPAGDGRAFAFAFTSLQTANTRRAYRQGGGGQRYLEVDNSGWYGTGTFEASLRMAETLTAWDTGTNLYPTWGVSFSRAADRCTTLARQWMVLADNKTLIALVKSDSATLWGGIYFGDIDSLVSGDAYACVLIGRNSTTGGSQGLPIGAAAGANAAGHQHHVMRAYTQAGSAKDTVHKLTDALSFQTLIAGTYAQYMPMVAHLPFPNPQNGGIYAAPMYMHEQHTVQTQAVVVRGRIRGMYAYAHDPTTANDGDVFVGSGEFAGKTLQYTPMSGSDTTSATLGMFVEISDTW